MLLNIKTHKITGNTLKIYALFISMLVLFSTLQGCSSAAFINTIVSAERPPLHDAALTGNLNELERLLSQGANFRQFDNSGFAPMHWAATTAFDTGPEMIQALLDAGADPNIQHKTALMTPLFFATTGKVVQTLVDGGANINARAVDQGTPLHSAKTAETVEILLNNGADINAENSQGQTPKMTFQTTLAYFEKNEAYVKFAGPVREKIQALNTNNGGQRNAYKARKNTFSRATKNPPKTTVAKNKAPQFTPQKDIDDLITSQPCEMQDSQWVYTGASCLDLLPDGNGSAIHKKLDIRFEGSIYQGKLVYGVLFNGDTNIYEGGFDNGKASGSNAPNLN